MKQFGKIFKYEIKNYFASKAFVGVTLFLVAAIALVMFFPRIVELFDSGDKASSDELPIMLIVSNNEETSDLAEKAFSAAFADYNVKKAGSDIEDLKRQITDGKAECAFVMNSLTSYTYYVNNLSMYDMNASIANEVLSSINRMIAMMEFGLSQDEASAILTANIEGNTEKLGKDQMQNFFYTYIMIFALYMVILLYGQMVATNVATEKSSRAMELLITSAKPVAMMFGKVIASCIAGLLQLTAIFGSALLFYKMNTSYWGDNAIVKSIFDMPVDLLLYMLLFFVLGFFIYAFMYGAVGSTVSRMEDVNVSVMPITMLFVIAFMVVMFSMSSGDVDNIVMKICSYIPFTSPMAMFTRLAMSTVAPIKIIISIAILVISTIGVGILSSKIYRVGVLLYGTKPNLISLIKSLRSA
ncbi:MAG: ABC transporter permease [Candidatus Scatomorpha sp.]|jgi:ABC-2 type transport system permease protein